MCSSLSPRRADLQIVSRQVSDPTQSGNSAAPAEQLCSQRKKESEPDTQKPRILSVANWLLIVSLL